MRRVLARICAFALLVTACSGGSSDADSATSNPDPETTISTSPSTTDNPRPTVVPSTQPDVPLGVFVSDDIVDAARRQVADDTGVAAADFQVERALQVTWNDGSLGCPQEGQSYTQALVDGFWVVLTHDGDVFDYRSAIDARFRACVGGAPPASTYVDR